ncbi:CPBP family intramembrane metalloprotease [Myxococcota bacterium]|nr:CPBP family intramembrane metalloprotease [Myxococcota bacterium]
MTATLVEVGVVFLLTCLAIRGFLAVQSGLGLRDDWRIVVSLIFIYVPVVVGRLTRRPVDPDVLLPEPLLPALLRAARATGKVVLAIYPAFVVGNHFWQSRVLPWITAEVLDWRRPIPPRFPEHGLPEDLLLIVAWQLVAVAYAEELFYRGWMQTRLEAAFRPPARRVLGAPIGAAFWITAVLFTLGHSLVVFQWWQPFILFPALVFGWLRVRTGNVLAGTLFHALANVAMICLDTLYGVRPP